MRNAREVFDDHLSCADLGDVETDIRRNFSPECLLITSEGVFRGHNGIRQAARLLDSHLPEVVFEYTSRVVEGEMAFLEWTGKSAEAAVHDGADTFIVRDGKICAMTAHYTITKKQ